MANRDDLTREEILVRITCAILQGSSLSEYLLNAGSSNINNTPIENSIVNAADKITAAIVDKVDSYIVGEELDYIDRTIAKNNSGLNNEIEQEDNYENDYEEEPLYIPEEIPSQQIPNQITKAKRIR